MIRTIYRQWYTLRGTIKHLKTSTLLCLIRFFYWNRGYFFDVLFVLGGQNLVVLYPFFKLNSILLLFFMMSLIRKNNDLLSKFYMNERNVNTFFLLFGKRSAELFILSNFVLFIIIIHIYVSSLMFIYICNCITHMLLS